MVYIVCIAKIIILKDIVKFSFFEYLVNFGTITKLHQIKSNTPFASWRSALILLPKHAFKNLM